MLCLRNAHPTSVVTLHIPDATSFCCFTLRMSSDLASSARGQSGVEITLSMQAGRALLDRIPVNSRLYAVLLDSSIRVNNSRLKRRCLFVVSVYAPTDCSSLEATDGFYRKLSRLIRSVRSMDVTVVADDFDTQLGYLAETEWRIGGRFFYPSRSDQQRRSYRPGLF